MKTTYYEALTEEQKDEAESVVLSFTEHMYIKYRLTPEKWDESALEQVCVHTLPEIMVTDESYFTSLAPVLCAFFEFLAERHLVKSASGLAKKVRELDQEIMKNALDPGNWNIAKTIFMAAEEAGVDITNEKERDEFLETITEGPLAGTLVKKVLEKDWDPSPPEKVEKRKKKTKEEKGKEKGKEKEKNEKHTESLCQWIKP